MNPFVLPLIIVGVILAIAGAVMLFCKGEETDD